MSQIQGRPHSAAGRGVGAGSLPLHPADCRCSVPRDSEIAMRNRKVRALAASARVAALAVAMLAVPSANASFLSGEALDTAANVLSWFILIVIPPAFIALFWIVHVLPEKIAEKRHHPNKDGIHVLCLLSLVFGGMLWPIAWLWAYTRPLGHKLAYGT